MDLEPPRHHRNDCVERSTHETSGVSPRVGAAPNVLLVDL